MIEAIKTFIESFAGYLTLVWDVITSIVERIVSFVKVVVQAVQFGINVIGVLPPIYVIFGVATVLVLIVYVLIGRESGD